MDRAYIERENVIERYVRGTLAPDDVAAFEIYMLEHPDVAEDTQYTHGLNAAMQAARSELFAAGTPAAEPRASRRPFRRYAAAAAVLFAALLLASTHYYRESEYLGAELARLRAPSSVSNEIWLEPLRGAGALIIERQPGEAILLRAVVAGSGEGPYRIELLNADGLPFWSQTDVFADAEPSVAVFARDLPFGEYRLVVTAQDDGTAVADYSLELIRAGATE